LAAQRVIAPVVPDLFGAHGLAGLLELVSAVRQDLGASCQFSGAVISRATRTKLSGEVVAKLQADLGGLVLGVIPDSVKIGEALAASLPVWEHAPGSPVALAMASVCDEVLNPGKGVRNVA
jgi:cellulose biosynthesis protein BcsQ